MNQSLASGETVLGVLDEQVFDEVPVTTAMAMTMTMTKVGAKRHERLTRMLVHTRAFR